MKSKILVALGVVGIIAASPSAYAQWTGSGGYLHVADSEVDVGAIYASAGYRFNMQNNFYFVPEVRLGVGVTEKTYREFVPGHGTVSVDAKLGNLYGLTGRLQYEFSGGTYLFAVPSYTNIEVKASGNIGGGMKLTISDNSWEAGVGLGFGYKFSPTSGIELSYENIDSTDTFSLGFRINF